MALKQQPARSRGRWVYAYELDPPQPVPRFKRIRMLLHRARLAARRGGRLWTGRIVVEASITHILVVTDHPAQERKVDRAIETELRHLNMNFALTGPARFAFPLAASRPHAGRKPARS